MYWLLSFLFIFTTYSHAGTVALSSPIFTEDMYSTEFELALNPIFYKNPCDNITQAISCENDAANNQIIVRYTLDITASVDVDETLALNFLFTPDLVSAISSVRLYQNNIIQSSPLVFTASGNNSYQLEFKIKYLGDNIGSEQKTTLNFSI